MKTDSVVTRYSGYCALCGKPTQTEHHLLFGIGIRELAEDVMMNTICLVELGKYIIIALLKSLVRLLVS